jgi:hypothetical protein
MSRIVLVVYRPVKGREEALKALVKKHHSVLIAHGLATSRTPVIMSAEDGSIIEVFEWKSADAIREAHANTEITRLWQEFSEVCTYEKPAHLPEFHNLFPEFEPVH